MGNVEQYTVTSRFRSSRSFLRPALLLLVMGMVSLGCGKDPADSRPINIKELSNKLVSVAEAGGALEADQIAVIELDANFATGYRWHLDSNADDKIQLVGSEFVPNPNGLLGAPGTQKIYLAGIEEGEGRVGLSYRREQESAALATKDYNIEVREAYTGDVNAVIVSSPNKPEVYDGGNLSLPASFSWCDEGGCTPVQNQGSCGSCWAFATVGPMEHVIKIASGVDVNLSEQYLVSCNSEGWDCGGGWWAHDYHIDKTVSGELEAGTVDESVFPYSASDEACNPPHAKSHQALEWAHIIDRYTTPSVDQIKEALYEHGPLSVAVCVNSEFQSYNSGVFTGPSCSSVNHGVTLVGWNDDEQAWTIKNSWGPSWGENGYMRIGYNVSQIGRAAAYVIYEASLKAGYKATYNDLTVSFEDQSTAPDGDTIVSWAWDFGDGTSSDERNPVHTFAQLGTYEVSLTVEDDKGETDTYSQNITVPYVPEYCDSYGTTSSMEWLAGVQVGTFSNPSDAAGYTDFTNMVVPLNPGTHAVTLTPGYSSTSYTEYFRIWIDFNRDGDFEDAGELLFSEVGNSPVSGSLVIPADVSVAQTRMRVSVKFGDVPNPCGSFSYGEVEDYTVDFSGNGSNPPVADFSYSVSELTVDFTDESVDLDNDIVSWAWNFGDGTASQVQHPSYTYAAEGTYSVMLTVTDSENQTDSMTADVTVEKTLCTDDIDCDDGVPCTNDTCDLDSGICIVTPDDTLCDNGAFCDGQELCDAAAGCLDGVPPCVGDCDETADECITECEDVIYEAEDMAHSTGGSITDGWNIWSNGYASFTHDFVGGETELLVSAAGDYAGGEWPNMTITVDGTEVYSGTVDSDTWADYPISFDVAAGEAEVRVNFTNDYYNPPEDRNLLLDKVTIVCGGVEPVCGDGTVDPGEECDDGNTVDGDGCDANCNLEPFCGDGTVDPGEECDDGNTVNGDGCDSNCNLEPVCGDGTVDPGEECDDGNTVDGDGCDSNCNLEPFCGDGTVDPGEECDDGNTVDGDGCDSNCNIEPDPNCGNGTIDPGEECDDGNTVDGDGCDSNCNLEPFCGDGTVDPGEECDDGNTVDGDGCDSNCNLEPFCGDGTVDPGEECDDGNTVNGDGCDSNCNLEPFCGDGTVDPGEECDDGNTVNGDGCDSNCNLEPVCGDGTVDPGEECDDGNTVNGDGCDSNCNLEPFCGDGTVDPGEECDDGNTVDGDGCDSNCNIEPSDDLMVVLDVNNDWGSGYCANVVITNNAGSATVDWTVVIDVQDADVYSTWNTDSVTGTGLKTLGPVGWNAAIQSGATMNQAGFCANRPNGSSSMPSVVSATGVY